MHPSCLILLLLAVCIGTGLQAHVLQCRGLHCNRRCLLGVKEHGPIEQHDVQFLLGIDLTACSDPAALENVQNFTQQILCLGLGYQPLDGVALGDELVTVGDLNNKFRCSEESLHFHANTIQQVVDFYNNVLEVSKCFQVHNMHICGFGSRKNVGWATVQLQVCTEDGKHIHVFKPYATLHGVEVDLKENDRLTEISDLLMPMDYNNAILLVPEASAPSVVEVFKWRIAKDAASGQDDLSKLREFWRNLCSQDRSQQDVVRCDEITNQMVAMCKEYRSIEDKHKMQKLEACVRKMYPENPTQQENIMHNENLKMCKLLRVAWTTSTELNSCMEIQEKAVWEQSVEFMTTVKNTVLSFVQMSFDAICYVNSCVDWVVQHSWKLIAVAWYWKKTTIISSFLTLMGTLYKFSKKLEKAEPGSESTWKSISYYLLGCILVPFSLLRGVKKEHKEFIRKKASKNDQATRKALSDEIDSKLSTNIQKSQEKYDAELQQQISKGHASTRREILSEVDKHWSRIKDVHIAGIGEIKTQMTTIEELAMRVAKEELREELQARPIESNAELMLMLANKQH